VRVNTNSPQMKMLLENNCNSAREVISRLVKSTENPIIVTDLDPATTGPLEVMRDGSFEEVAQSRTAALNHLLADIAAITVSSSPHYGDPSVPVTLSQKLNDLTKELVQEIRKSLVFFFFFFFFFSFLFLFLFLPVLRPNSTPNFHSLGNEEYSGTSF